MPFDFPSNPTPGQIFIAGGAGYTWNGYAWQLGGTHGAWIGDTPPVSPTHGQFFWESDTGALYVYYNDGNSQQWVQVNGTVGGEGGGGAGVTISDTLPVSPVPGQLFWESDTGIFAIYYDDGTSQQWVQIGAGPKGDTGPQGAVGPQGIPGPVGPEGPAGSDASMVSFRDFGGGPEVADNSTALMAFNTYARAESVAGRAVVIRSEPGIHNFDHSLCLGYLHGISKLYWDMRGTIWQNTYNQSVSGDDDHKELAWGSAFWPLFYDGYRVDTTTIGATTVKLKTVGDHTNFAAGSSALLVSLDLMYYGFPSNCDQFEFVKIVSKDAGTGVITLGKPLRYAHRDDYPDAGNLKPCGKARLFPLDLPFNGKPNFWDVDHSYWGGTFRIAPTSNLTLMYLMGRKSRFIDCDLPGATPTICEHAQLLGGRLSNGSEPDKLVSLFEMDGVHDASTVNFGFQSSSMDRISIRNCYLPNTFIRGAAKDIAVDNCYLGTLTGELGYGSNRSFTLRNSIVANADDAAIPFKPIVQGAVIDGTNVTFSNGTIRILLSYAPTSKYMWNCIPGQGVSLLCGGGGQFLSGPIGQGVVTRIYEDATYSYIETTLPYATLPAWANGQVRFNRTGRVIIENCTGGDGIRRMSDATARGKQPGELFRDVFLGKPALDNGHWTGRTGRLIRLGAVVHQKSAGTSGRLIITNYSVLRTDTMADAVSMQMDIDTSIVGRREFTLTAMTGKQPNDQVLVASVAQTMLPSDRWFGGGSLFWGYAGIDFAGSQPYQLPIVEIEMEFDVGLFAKSIPVAKDTQGSSVAAVVGTLL